MADASEAKTPPISLIPKKAALTYKPSIETYLELITENCEDEKDGHWYKLRLNEMTGRGEVAEEPDEWRLWTDADEAALLMHFQSHFGLYSAKQMEYALQIYFDANRVNPLTDIIDGLEWDGKPRIMTFLHDVLKCEDTPYTRECSRLIFSGGIHRAYEPGCKFDSTVVLIGDQGCGKSTTARLLAMEDRFYRVIKTISGKEGVETLRGVWIGEMAELMAMTKVKEIEAVKAFLTEQKDDYRPPYGKNVLTYPRRCVFVGTTNNPQFLTDKTGNRRFLPVQCGAESSAAKILAHEAEIRAHIAQCWAEAKQLYMQGKLKPHENFALLDEITRAQEAAMEEDYRVGLIRQYCDRKREGDVVTLIELWREALGQPEDRQMSPLDQKELRQIMYQLPGWERTKGAVRTAFGVQRGFVKRRLTAVEEIFGKR